MYHWVSCGTAAPSESGLPLAWAWESSNSGHRCPTRAHHRTSSPLYPTVTSPPWWWAPKSSADQSRGSGEGAQNHGCRKPSSCWSRPLCPALGAARTRVLVSRVLQASQSPSLSPSSPPMSRVGSSFPSGVWGQDCDAQSVALTSHLLRWVSTHVISLFLWIPSQGHRSIPNFYSSFPTWSFLTSLVVQESSCHFLGSF